MLHCNRNWQLLFPSMLQRNIPQWLVLKKNEQSFTSCIVNDLTIDNNNGGLVIKSDNFLFRNSGVYKAGKRKDL